MLKKAIIIIFLLISCFQISYSQTDSKQQQATVADTLKTVQKQVDTIYINEVAKNDFNEIDSIGFLRLNGSVYALRKKRNKTENNSIKYKIVSSEVWIKDKTIKSIILTIKKDSEDTETQCSFFGQKNCFSEYKANNNQVFSDTVDIKLVSVKAIPVKTIKHLNQLDHFYFVLKGKKENDGDWGVFDFIRPKYKKIKYKISLGDVLDFNTKLLGSYDVSPADTIFHFDKGGQKRIITKEPMSNVFDFKIFSDYNGAFANQPDGIVQTELKFNFYLNVFPIGRNLYHGAFVGGNYIKPYVYFAKFSDKYSYLTLAKQNDTLHLNTLELNRYSFAKAGAYLNIFKWEMPALSSEITLDFFSSAYMTKTQDTVVSTEIKDSITIQTIALDKNNIIAANTGFYTRWRIKQFSKLWLDIGLKVNYSYVMNKPYPFILENNVYEDTISLFNKIALEPQLQIGFAWNMQLTYVAPKGRKFFFRTVYNGALNNPLRYYNFQIGYSLSVSDLLKNK